MENYENQIKLLEAAYKELASSKMVLAEKHISKLLRVVAASDGIYNLIAEKILGFDFSRAMTDLLNKDVELKEICSSDAAIPFAFCVLNEIDNRNIQTVALVRRIFNSDSEDAFHEFCERVVGSFVKQVREQLSAQDGESPVIDPATSLKDLFTKDLISRVKYIVSEISEKVNDFKKVPEGLRKDIDIICYSIELCVDSGEFIGVFGLLSGLKQCVYPLKKFKDEIEEIDVLLETINQ